MADGIAYRRTGQMGTFFPSSSAHVLQGKPLYPWRCSACFDSSFRYLRFCVDLTSNSPLLTTLGAGAGCAIEDVHLLSGLLVPSLIKSASDIKHAFRTYDALRRPRSQELVRRSEEQGRLLELESELPNLVDGNKNAWQQHLERELDVSPRWVWGVDLEALLLQAKELFEKSKAMA